MFGFELEQNTWRHSNLNEKNRNGAITQVPLVHKSDFLPFSYGVYFLLFLLMLAVGINNLGCRTFHLINLFLIPFQP